jgi:hypothetical protein
MSNEITTTAANRALEWLLNVSTPPRPTKIFVALGTSSSAAGTFLEEITGTGYARASAAFASAASRATSNTAACTFGPATAADWLTCEYAAVVDGSAGNKWLWVGSLTTKKTVGNGDTLTIAAGDLDVTFNAWSD